jgi:hypothetical protein
MIFRQLLATIIVSKHDPSHLAPGSRGPRCLPLPTCDADGLRCTAARLTTSRRSRPVPRPPHRHRPVQPRAQTRRSRPLRCGRISRTRHGPAHRGPSRRYSSPASSRLQQRRRSRPPVHSRRRWAGGFAPYRPHFAHRHFPSKSPPRGLV